MKTGERIQVWLRHAAWAVLLAVGGCGVLSASSTEFTSQASGPEGREFFVEDIEEIVNDAALSDPDKREALRDLGIEDEDLIGVLLTL